MVGSRQIYVVKAAILTWCFAVTIIAFLGVEFVVIFSTTAAQSHPKTVA
jgi:hypothetical protein